MKMIGQYILSVSLLFACCELSGQTLTCHYNCPKAGEVFSTKTGSPVLHTSGQNQLWDFTKMEAVITGIIVVKYVPVSAAPSSSLYPQAHLLQQETGKNFFLETGTDGVKLSTAANSTVNAQSMVLPLPFSYGSSYSETIFTTTLSGPDTIITKTSKWMDGVGTGTLLLPTGKFTDVLRISGKLVESHTKNGITHGKTFTTYFNYYYSEKISHPVLYSSNKHSTGNEYYVPYTQFVSEVTAGSKDFYIVEPTFKVAPNPASGIIRLTTTNNEGGEITVNNSFGQKVLSNAFSSGNAELDLSSFPSGLYTLVLQQKGLLQVQKFVISH